MKSIVAFLPMTLLLACSDDSRFAGGGNKVKNSVVEQKMAESAATANEGPMPVESTSQVSQSNTGAPVVAAPQPPPAPNTCYVDEEAAIYLDLSGSAPKIRHYNNLALDLVFNSDAFDFDIALIQVVVDDGKPIVQIGGQKVFESTDYGYAKIHSMNVSLKGLLRGGTNLVQGSFYDEFGSQAKLSIKLRGTWKTYEGCFKDFNHRYQL